MCPCFLERARIHVDLSKSAMYESHSAHFTDFFGASKRVVEQFQRFLLVARLTTDLTEVEFNACNGFWIADSPSNDERRIIDAYRVSKAAEVAVIDSELVHFLGDNSRLG